MPASLDRPLRMLRVLVGRDLEIRVDAEVPVLGLGTPYGRHVCYPRPLGPDSVVYSFGVGEDVSFDLGLMETFGLRVHAFDPTPRSVAWVESQGLPAGFVMNAVGVAGTDGEATFSPPKDPTHVSHTLLEGAETRDRAITVPVRRLSTLMTERGHTHLDVLKMDVEGAEYDVLDDLIRARLDVRQILVEFHHQLKTVGLEPTRRALRTLREAGYLVVAVSDSGHEVSFVRADLLAQEGVVMGSDELPVWMDPIELSQLLAVVEAIAPRRVLEWGSGGSTRALLTRSPFIEEYVSVEHLPQWHAKVKATVIDPRLSLNLVEPDLPLGPGKHSAAEIEEWDNRAEVDRTLMASYIGFPRSLGGRFDLVLVDGRARCFCVAEGFDLLESGGVLVLHDAQREEYHAAMWRLGRPVFLTPWKQGQICLVRKT